MPTNKERREVAENLRNMCICGCRYKEEFYDLLVETVMRAWDFHEFSDVADRLAELTEPEERTCHLECVKSGPFYDVFRFDCCGKEYSESRTDDGATELPLAVCPFCGAKVVHDA